MSQSDSTSNVPDPLELAWAAGFFDGEGCIRASCDDRHGYRYLSLAVSQVELEPLARFQRAVGCGAITGPHTQRQHPNSRPIYRYHLGKRRDILGVLNLLWPYLSGPKKRQAETAKSEERIAGGTRCKLQTHCKRGHPFEGDNLHILPNGYRLCLECRRATGRESARRRYWQRKSELAKLAARRSRPAAGPSAGQESEA